MEHNSRIQITGHLKIYDPNSADIYVDQHNAIHFENISEALAYGLANKHSHYISEMHFGRGGTTIDSSGVIVYQIPNTQVQNGDLYAPTFYKLVDDTDNENRDPFRNNMQIRHIPNTVYSDILVTCLLDYGEPAGQLAFDNAASLESTFVFDELGLKGWSAAGAATGKLLTHVIFHPVQKSLNRQIQIDYTVRIQSLTNLTG